MADKTEKKGFLSKLLDNLDKKTEVKSKQKSCGCCCSCGNTADSKSC